MKRAADLYETQQAMLVLLAVVLLFVLGMLGALSWVIIAITFLALRLTSCSTVTALYVAGFAVTIGMILYRDWTAWFAAPMALMQSIITPYINEGLVRLILNEEHMAMMVSDMRHYFVVWARSPMTWLYCLVICL